MSQWPDRKVSMNLAVSIYGLYGAGRREKEMTYHFTLNELGGTLEV